MGSLNINDLPDEILMMIFSYFSAIKLQLTIFPVCSKWHRLGQDPNLRRLIVLRSESFFPQKNLEKHWCSIIRRSPLAQKIEISVKSSKISLDQVMSVVSESCPNLEVLKISSGRLGKSCIGSLVEGCPNLREVELHNVPLHSMSVLTDLKHLKSFKTHASLSRFHRDLESSSTFIPIFVSKCSNLEHLDIPNMPLQKDDLASIVHNMKDRLKTWSVSIVHDTVEIFGELVGQCSKIENLYIKGASVRYIDLKFLPKLSSLNTLKNLEIQKSVISSCQIYPSSVSHDRNKLNLQTLTIKDCGLSNEAIAYMITFLDKLMSLTIEQVSHMSDEGFTIFLDKCDSLKRLIASQLDQYISDSSFEVLNSKTSLEYLEISNCEGLSLEFEQKFRIRNPRVQFTFTPSVISDTGNFLLD